MSMTIDCGEGRHVVCRGAGRSAYMFPQEDRYPPDPEFVCGCRCHHADARDTLVGEVERLTAEVEQRDRTLIIAAKAIDGGSAKVAALTTENADWRKRVVGLLSVIDKMAPASTMQALRGFGPTEEEAAPYAAICDEARAAAGVVVSDAGEDQR